MNLAPETPPISPRDMSTFFKTNEVVPSTSFTGLPPGEGPLELVPYLPEPLRHHQHHTYYISKLADIVATIFPICLSAKLLKDPANLRHLDLSALEELVDLSKSTISSSQPVCIAPTLLSQEPVIHQLSESEAIKLAQQASSLGQALCKFFSSNPAELRYYTGEFTIHLWLLLKQTLRPSQTQLALILKTFISQLKLINVAETSKAKEMKESQFLTISNTCYFHTIEIASYFCSAMLATESNDDRFRLSIYLANLTKAFLLANHLLYRDSSNEKCRDFSQRALGQIYVVIKQFLSCSLGGQLPDALLSILKQAEDPFKDLLDRGLKAAARSFECRHEPSQLDSQLIKDATDIFRFIQNFPDPATFATLATFPHLIELVKVTKRMIASALMTSFENCPALSRFVERMVELLHQQCIVLELLAVLILMPDTLSADILRSMIASSLSLNMFITLAIVYSAGESLSESWLFWRRPLHPR